MTTDEDALKAAIRANPDDNAPWLVLADWYQERGQVEREAECRTRKAVCQLRSVYVDVRGDRGWPVYIDVRTAGTCPAVCIVPLNDNPRMHFDCPWYGCPVPIPLGVSVMVGGDRRTLLLQRVAHVLLGGPWHWPERGYRRFLIDPPIELQLAYDPYGHPFPSGPYREGLLEVDSGRMRPLFRVPSFPGPASPG